MSDILAVKGIDIVYETQDGVVHALNGIDLTLKEGSSVGLVGETGAGKTTLAKGIMKLTRSPPGKIRKGKILYQDTDILTLDDEKTRELRGKEISMIFQDPMTSLNPVMTVGEQIAEAVITHKKVSSNEAMEEAQDMLELVGIPKERCHEYPHQFSGGMKQRVIIAIALTCNPKVLIADEPTTALDVTIQAQVLDLMNNLRSKLKTTMLLITHDLGVVAQNCEYVAVIYAGEIVEYGTVHEVFKNMKHPYTVGLFNSLPSLTKTVRRLIPIEGLMPDPMNLPNGCKFSTRCKWATELCNEEHPEMVAVDGEHIVRCFIQEGKVRKEVNDDTEK